MAMKRSVKAVTSNETMREVALDEHLRGARRGVGRTLQMLCMHKITYIYTLEKDKVKFHEYMRRGRENSYT